MTPKDKLSAEARELIDGYLDDRLDASGVARLKELIIADADVRRAYMQVMSMLGGVHRFLQERPILPGAAQPEQPLAPIPLEVTAPLPLDAPPQAGLVPSSGWLSPFGQASAFLFAVVIACSVGVWMWLARPATDSDVATKQDVPQSQLPLEVRLDSGTARLSLPNVGYVVVDGPAEFTLLSPRRARLSKGRIKMRVTEASGRGFVVETPDGEVKDLGTEFGIDVTSGRETGLVVFEGEVDLRLAEGRSTTPTRIERFVGGEGAVFNKEGRLDRLALVVAGTQATFSLPTDPEEPRATRVIASVTDNFRKADTMKFYEIVPRGLGEDALAYVDRKHEWNGIKPNGIPKYLMGADYVKTFNSDQGQANRRIYVSLAQPARLYVFFDVRGETPEWLLKGFRNTGDRIGLDAAPANSPEFKTRNLQTGAGNSIDQQFAVWERIVETPGTVILESNPVAPHDDTRAMYGIAAVQLANGERSKIP